MFAASPVALGRLSWRPRDTIFLSLNPWIRIRIALKRWIRILYIMGSHIANRRVQLGTLYWCSFLFRRTKRFYINMEGLWPCPECKSNILHAFYIRKKVSPYHLLFSGSGLLQSSLVLLKMNKKNSVGISAGFFHDNIY